MTHTEAVSEAQQLNHPIKGISHSAADYQLLYCSVLTPMNSHAQPQPAISATQVGSSTITQKGHFNRTDDRKISQRTPITWYLDDPVGTVDIADKNGGT